MKNKKIIISKVCSICPEKGSQPIEAFQRFVRRRYGREEICYTPYCKSCIKEKTRGTKKDWEKVKAAINKWRNKNKSHVAEYKRKKYEENPEIVKEYNKKSTKKIREEMPDWWVSIQVARGEDFTRYEVPKELIEIKRKQLKLIRNVKEKQQVSM